MEKGNHGRHQGLLPIPRNISEVYVSKVLEFLSPFADLFPAGSFRRGKDFQGDLDFVTVPKVSLEVFWEKVKSFLGEPTIGGSVKVFPRKKISIPDRKGQFIFQFKNFQEVAIDFYICESSQVETYLLYLTGSADFNRFMRFEAMKKDLVLSQQGLKVRSTGEFFGIQTERGVFESLGLVFKSPSERNLVVDRSYLEKEID